MSGRSARFDGSRAGRACGLGDGQAGRPVPLPLGAFVQGLPEGVGGEVLYGRLFPVGVGEYGALAGLGGWRRRARGVSWRLVLQRARRRTPPDSPGLRAASPAEPKSGRWGGRNRLRAQYRRVNFGVDRDGQGVLRMARVAAARGGEGHDQRIAREPASARSDARGCTGRRTIRRSAARAIEWSGTSARAVTAAAALRPRFGYGRFGAGEYGLAEGAEPAVDFEDFRSIAEHQRRSVGGEFAGQAESAPWSDRICCANAASVPGASGIHSSASTAVRDSTASAWIRRKFRRAARTLAGVPQPSSSGAPILSTVLAAERSYATEGIPARGRVPSWLPWSGGRSRRRCVRD